MATSDSDARMEFVGALGEEFVERFRRGERPSLREYTEKHPQYAEDIEELFPALVMMEDLAPQDRESLGLAADGEAAKTPELEKLGDFRIIREVGRGGMGVVYEAEQVSLGRHVALKVLPSSALPDSKHVRRFEREAKSAAKLHHTNIVPVFGVGTENDLHYYVMQFIQGLPLDEVIEELKKIQTQPTGAITAPVRASQVGDSSRDAREQSVADVARSLMTGQFAQTQIGESDSDADGESASPELVQTVTELSPQAGDTSTARLSETFDLSGSFSGSAVRLGKSGVHSAQRKPLTYWESVANIGMQVADAMHYAHEQGILHRDIKPSNLLLDLRGTTWVTDFGLAKATDQQDITHTGDILGTLRYMPPEAFEGKTDARSDVYSLGLTLYELLAFQPAFGNRDRHQLVKQVTTEAAPRLDRLNPDVPRDLVTIVHKAIDRDAAHRYQTARELEEDLHRFLEDEPIKARRISLAERLARWSRRNRSLAASLATLATVILVVAVGSTIAAGYFRNMSSRLAEANQELEESEERETKRAEDMEDLAVAHDVAAQEALAARDEAQAARYEVTFGAALQALTTPDRYQYGQGLLDGLIPRPGEEDRRGMEWYLLDSLPDPSGGRVLANFRTSYRNAVCFSPDDNYVAVSEFLRDILILDAETGAVVKRLVGNAPPATKLVWAHGGSRLVSASRTSIRVWDVESGLEEMTLPGYMAFALSPDETRVATRTDDGVQVWDFSNGELLETFKTDDQGGRFGFDMDWSLQNQIAFTSASEVRLLDVETREERVLTGISGESESPYRINGVCFSPDGSQLAAIRIAPGDQPVLIWDLESGAEPRTLPAMMGVTDVEWSHDGSRLATTSIVGRAVEIWERATGERVRRLSGHSERVGGCSWSHDDRQVASTSADGTVRLWEIDQEVAAPDFAGHQGLVRDLAWGPGGRYFATVDSKGMVRIWDVRFPREAVFTFRGHDESSATGVDWHPSANRLVSCDYGAVLVWEWEGDDDARVIREIPGSDGRSTSVIWSPDGTQIAVARGWSDDEDVRTYDPLTGEELRAFPLDGADSVSWERDRNGNSLLAAAGYNEVTVWNVETQEVVWSRSDGNENYTCVALSPQGDRVAFSGSASGVAFGEDAGQEPIMGILDLDTEAVRWLHGHQGSVLSICWTADGTRLLTAGTDGTSILWNAETGRQLVAFDAPDRVSLYAARISPDQLRIAIAGATPGIQVLDATPSYVEELAPELERGLTTRIKAEPTASDLVLRGRVLARQGRWDEAADDFERAARSGADGGSSSSWFETTWWVAGPYAEALDDPQPPEQTDPFPQISAADEAAEETAWSAAPFSSSLDLGRLFDHQEQISAYAVTRLYATEPQEIGLLLGADDQVKVWFNGAEVYWRAGDSAVITDDEAVEIRLDPGWNTLLFKVSNNTGAHGLFANFSEDARELAQAFDRNEQWEQALKWADRALADRPDDVSLHYVRGRAALHTGERQIAGESFDRVVETVGNRDLAHRRIAGLHLEHAKSLNNEEQRTDAAASLERARELYEQLVGSNVANEQDAAGLADVLFMTMPRPTWAVVDPVEMKSALGEEGATLTRLEDGSILASGNNPGGDTGDTYQLIIDSPLKTVTAVRLEALTHDSLPNRGPGRRPNNGNFAMSWHWWQEPNHVRTVFDSVDADYHNPRFPINYRHWNIGGGAGESHEAVYRLNTPVENEAGLRFSIDMRFTSSSEYPSNNLGRFRISVTGDPNGFETAARRLDIQKITNGWGRLAATYHVTGDEAALDALLEREPLAATAIVALTVDAAGWAEDEDIDPAPVTEAIESALRSAPGSEDLINIVLEICENASKPQLREAGFQALFDHQRAMGASGEQQADLFRRLGTACLRTDEYHLAVAAFEQAIELTAADSDDDSSLRDLLGYLGQSQYRTGDYPQARETLERGIAARGESEPTIHLGPRWWYLAMALAQLDEETERAESIYEKLTAELETSSEDDRESNERYRVELAELLGIK